MSFSPPTKNPNSAGVSRRSKSVIMFSKFGIRISYFTFCSFILSLKISSALGITYLNFLKKELFHVYSFQWDIVVAVVVVIVVLADPLLFSASVFGVT